MDDQTKALSAYAATIVDRQKKEEAFRKADAAQRAAIVKEAEARAAWHEAIQAPLDAAICAAGGVADMEIGYD